MSQVPSLTQLQDFIYRVLI